MSKRLSVRQATEAMMLGVWRFIAVFIDEHGYAPSLRQIAQACFTSHGNVVRYLDLLEARGVIEREMGQARALRLLKRPPVEKQG